MLGIPAGLLTANAIEWVFHKHVLHRLGKRPKSFWNFHWRDHHRASRLNAFRDPDYAHSVLNWNAQGKEAAALVVGGLLVLPLLPVAPVFTATLWYSGVNYYRRHKKAHLDAQWARAELPWHYDHHMGPNPDANWCVTRPWFDIIMGTREPYVGTEAERPVRAVAA